MKLLISTTYILAGLLASALALSANEITNTPVVTGPEIWKDPSQPMNARVDDLIRRMSLAEKVAQLQNDAPRIYEFLIGDASDDIRLKLPMIVATE